MKISGIDEGFKELIPYLDEQGFRPYASCDGVLEHHENKDIVTTAYIGFLKSPRICQLLAAVYRDKDNFEIALSSQTQKEPYELYGNIISGNIYSVTFDNKDGNLTQYWDKIARGVADGSIKVSDEEIDFLEQLSNCLELDEEEDLSYSVVLNTNYQPYTRKGGKTNRVVIQTKDNGEYYLELDDLAEKLARNFGIDIKQEDLDEDFSNSNNFLTNYKGIVEISIEDDKIPLIPDIIRLARCNEKNAPKVESNEFDGYVYDIDDDYDDYDY